MGRNKQLNMSMREQRRTKILSGALKLFSTRGLVGTKISDIASETGMSLGLVYHYYKSKEQIYTTLVSMAFEKLNWACHELEKKPGTAFEKVNLAVSGLLDGIYENEDTSRYHLLVAQATASESIPDKTKQVIIQQNHFPYEVIAKIFEQGIQEGTVREYPASELSVLFWTTINGLAIYRFSHGLQALKPDHKIITHMFFKEY